LYVAASERKLDIVKMLVESIKQTLIEVIAGEDLLSTMHIDIGIMKLRNFLEVKVGL